jgi:two-component system OmpR family response regulator
MARILIVEDDRQIAAGLAATFEGAGHEILVSRDGEDARRRCNDSDFDLILLDLGLPERDGVTFLRGLRAAGKTTPVIVVTARSDRRDRLESFDAGADDYVVKPFDLAELEARARAVLRRAGGMPEAELRIAGLAMTPGEGCLHVGDRSVHIGLREYRVLLALMRHAGRVVSKPALLEELSDVNDELGIAAIEVYVHRLRRKIEGSGAEIATVRGFGYLLRQLDG